MTPVPEKAAPIPAEVVDAVVQFILSSRGLCHEGIEAMVTAGVQAGIKLADREARPSLPDSREERIRAEAAEDEREACARIADDAARDAGARSDRADARTASGTSVLAGYIFARTEAEAIAKAIRLRARARQGGNNG